MNEETNAIEEAREIFENFDSTYTFLKDKYGNYKDCNVHNLWIGFKHWYLHRRPN